MPFWWWNGATLTRARLHAQMQQMISAGIRQAVVISVAPNARLFGAASDDPGHRSDAWWTLLQEVCEDASTLGFSLWMYDQIGFAGANAQGQLIHKHPGYAGWALRRTVCEHKRGERTSVTCRDTELALAGYAQLTDGPEAGKRVDLEVHNGGVSWDGAPAVIVLVHAAETGFDYLSTEAGADLITQVHGQYEQRVGHWFGKVITGFFQDELPATPTWSRSFSASFEAQYGYDIVPLLGVLWEGEGEEASSVRRDYQEHRAHLAQCALFDPLADWFEAHNLLCGFDQPTPAREGDPVGGVRLYGDYLGSHARYGVPGSDHWGDSKVHSSLAHANGHQRTWIEAFHSTGWGGTLEETYDWLAPFFRRGANLYNPHAVYYATSGGWWEFAPPSTCWRQPYWPDYDLFAKALTRLSSLLSAGTHVCSTVLLSPTTTAQAYLTLAGPQLPAQRASAVYRSLNGDNGWVAERRGILDLAGIDYDILDERTIAHGTVDAGRLTIALESYRNVVLPAARAVHVETAVRLIELARSGARVICVALSPTQFLGGAENERIAAARMWRDALHDGVILLAKSADDVPSLLMADSVTITADAPYLHRRVADTHVITLFAHDDSSGTRQPILDWFGSDGVIHDLDWSRFWGDLQSVGYTFRASGERVAHLSIEGTGATQVQQWDPRSGARSELEVQRGPGVINFSAPFSNGPIAVLVAGSGLPAVDKPTLGARTLVADLPAPWLMRAQSTLADAWADAAASQDEGIVPIQVWRFDHQRSQQVTSGPFVQDAWRSTTATFGCFGLVAGPVVDVSDLRTGSWACAEWSLSRGIHKDPIHHDVLGPKGRVPEDFLHWDFVARGQWVALRTTLDNVEAPVLTLAVGANALRVVYVDGRPIPAEGAGYLTFSDLPTNSGADHMSIEIHFQADRDGPLRASFAVVRDPNAYRRPDWIFASGRAYPGRSTEITTRLGLDELPTDGSVLLGGDGPVSLRVNEIDVTRQGGFQPFPAVREVRAQLYDLRPHLRIGDNTITILTLDDSDSPTLTVLDSTPSAGGGLGLVSGPNWTANDGDTPRLVKLWRGHPGDPGFVCLRSRPHPLPFTSWLNDVPTQVDVVLPLIPDHSPEDRRIEHLRFTVPLGAVRLHVPTQLPFSLRVDGREIRHVDGWIELPHPMPFGTAAVITFEPSDGRRGGALLDGPVEVETAEVLGPLLDWAELGLRALAGSVTYRTSCTVDALPDDCCLELDLGEVRGTAAVWVNGRSAGRLAWGPWTLEVTDLLQSGTNEIAVVVRGTLAGYLDDASPTPAVYAGQTRSGLFGPVRLVARSTLLADSRMT